MKFNGNFTGPPTAPEVTVDLNDNSLSIVAECKKEARLDGWSREEIENVTREMLSGDRDHLLAVFAHFFLDASEY